MSILQRYHVTPSGLTPDQVREGGVRLREGALVIYPTDTLYAIGCCALDVDAVRRLRSAKGRETDKPLSVIAGDLDQARALTSSWSEDAGRLADAFWPGPLTLVLPAASTLPAELLAGALGVAVRVPASDLARALAREAGPLVATSANLAGARPCETVDLALEAFPLATLAFDIGPLEGSPSTIVDLIGSSNRGWRLAREGRIDGASVQAVLRRALNQTER